MSECYCDYDPPEVHRRNEVRARKEYRCEECPNRIKPGDRYEYVWGIWEGYAQTFRTCSDCVERRRFISINLPCFCWAHGNLQDDIRTAIEDAYIRAADEVRGLAFSFGRLVVRQRRARREGVVA